MQNARAEDERAVRVIQRNKCCTGGAAPTRQRRARRHDARAGIDLLQPVVRQVVDEATDEGMSEQARGGHPLVDDLRVDRLLHQGLAAPARPLAADVAVHEELGRNHVESLAHVFAHARHRLAATAGGVARFVMVNDAAQVIGKWLAARLRLRLGQGPLTSRLVPVLQRGELRSEVGFVLGRGGLEHLPLLGVQSFGVGTELPCLEPCELERDLFELGILEADGLRVALGLLGPSLELDEHARGQFGDGTCAQTLKVFGLERGEVDHEHQFCRAHERSSSALPRIARRCLRQAAARLTRRRCAASPLAVPKAGRR